MRLYTRLANYTVLNVAFVVAVWLRFRDDWLDVFGSNNYIALLLFVNLCWVVVTNILRYYKRGRLNLKRMRRWLLFIQIGLLHLLLVLAFNGIIKTYFSRLFMIYFYALLFILLPLIEWGVHQFLGWYRRRAGFKARVVIAGAGETMHQLAWYFNALETDFQERDVLEINDQQAPLLNQLEEMHKEEPVNELYCSATAIPGDVLQQLGTFCENNLIRIRLVLDYPKWETKPLEVVQYESIPVVNIPVTPLDEPANTLTKRIFDIVFSMFVLIFILSWLFPIIALLIKLSSRGPVIFRQKRTGLDNSEFDCFKFRSMRVNKTADLVQATKDDPRITSIGRFLRKTSLDELPQFINVLRGEMSVVGPRPHMLKHTEEYAQRVGNFMQRHAIRPGVTGLAQVKGYRGEISHFEHLANRVKYDRFYVENWSLALDLKIILLTVLTVIRAR